MKQSIFKITSNEKIARDIFKMTLAGDTSAITAPGQFVNIKLDGFFLRRPISVCDCVGENLTLIYKTVGNGTERISRMAAGDELDLLTGLGNGYNTKKSGGSPLLVGGGVGVPPMYMLCRELISEGKNVTVVLGFNSKDDVFYEDEFRALGADVHIATADGTYGIKGFVTDVIKDMQYTFFYTCGPEPMFRAMHKIMKTPGQYSFEERMGCGFGACMGCSCKTLTGNKRICKEGPVMESEEIIWAD
ncbi:MAG: dihydroorotate dehydrogenase electron transfer subunit [Oscillospiraceae bacterium]|nr:dihydroorotate dehydrogenase electron transfer subunit [Oscillospiraceae bacterium]